MTPPKIEQTDLRKIIDSINWNDVSGWSFTGEYTVFSGSHHIASYMHRNYPEQYPNSVPPIQRNLHTVQSSLWSLETVFERLQWQKQLFQEDKIDPGVFYRFCQEDIKVFYVNYRSIFDYVALIIGQLAIKSGQTSDKFEKLLNDIKNKRKCCRVLPEPIISLLDNELFWFYSAREMRKTIIHDGKDIIVFGTKDPISFQVINELDNLINIKEFSINENMVIDFELYSAYYMAHLYTFLDKFSRIALDITALKRHESGRYSHPGLGVLKEWLQKLELKLFPIQKLENTTDAPTSEIHGPSLTTDLARASENV